MAWPYHDLTPPPTAAIRRGEWKFIKRTCSLSVPGDDARNLLFNLAEDPEEKHNLYAQEQREWSTPRPLIGPFPALGPALSIMP